MALYDEHPEPCEPKKQISLKEFYENHKEPEWLWYLLMLFAIFF